MGETDNQDFLAHFTDTKNICTMLIIKFPGYGFTTGLGITVS